MILSRTLAKLTEFPYTPFWVKVAWFIVAVAGVRAALVLTTPGLLGVDGGAYLMNVNTVLGAPNLGIDNATRPPLSPGWFLVPFVKLWGADVGYKVFQAVAGLPSIGAAYLLYRYTFPLRGLAYAATALVAFELAQAEMLVSGYTPTWAFTFYLITLLGLLRIARGHTRTGMALVTFGVPMMAYTNLTVSGIALVSLPVAVGFLWATAQRRWDFLSKASMAGMAGVVIAATALPYFMGSAPGDGKLSYEGPILYWGPRVIDVFYLLWAVGAGAGAWRFNAPIGVKLMAVMGLTFAGITQFMSWDEAVVNVLFRPFYFIGYFTWPVTAWLAARILPQRWAVPVVAIAVLILATGFGWVYERQRHYSTFAGPEIVEAIGFVDSGNVATNSYALAHWIAGTTNNRIDARWTFTNPPPERWAEDEGHVRCLFGWVAGCDPHAAADAIGAEWVLVDARVPQDFYNALNGAPDVPTVALWAGLGSVPWLEPVYIDGPARLYAIRGEHD